MLQAEVQAASSLLHDQQHNLNQATEAFEAVRAEMDFLRRQLAKRDALIDNVWKSANSSFPDSSIVSIIKSEMKRIMETFQYEYGKYERKDLDYYKSRMTKSGSRFNTSPVVHQFIHRLASGAPVLTLLDEALLRAELSQEKYFELIKQITEGGAK